MIGKIIDNFELIKFVGKGSFGSVYQCIKESQLYAIKIFSSEYIFEEFAKGDDNRITREIDALKMVDSPFVAKYITDGSFIDNSQKYFYVVMDYVEGDDLNSVLKTAKLTIDEVKEVFNKILQGVSAIHEKHLIHRDLKPANIYLTNSGDIKILDFGLSKLIDFTSITTTGAQLGSPLYMSPEQISDSKNIDYRSDYYALGVILFKLLTNETPYGKVSSIEELYYKIRVEPPVSIRTFMPSIDNSIDNLIDTLLQKENYKRPNSIDEILTYLSEEVQQKEEKKLCFTPSFFVRLFNEKTVLEEYYKDGFEIEYAIFPVNHQSRQKNLLSFIRKRNIDFMIDPATMRLAYDSYSDVKGLTELPYAPQNLSRLELTDLNTNVQKQKYVKLVVDEQLKSSPPYVVAPFHVSNNSNLVRIKNDENENWFSLDVKLVNETRDYLNRIAYNGKLVAGFCVKTDILTTKTEKDYFLNVISALKCDMYWMYVDCIDNSSNVSQLYNYASTLLDLQSTTGKPVIAGRIGSFGLVLLAFGLFGFESGTSRFENFSEDLYKETSEPYNMYVRYYFPELLSNIAVERKNPAKIIQLLSSKTGENIKCNCPYCFDKDPSQLIGDSLTRKHFLYRRNAEIQEFRDLDNIEDRVDLIERRIKDGIENYKNLKPIFKDNDSDYLKKWLEVIDRLRKERL